MLYIDNDTIITLGSLHILDLLCEALDEEHHSTTIFVLRSCGDLVQNRLRSKPDALNNCTRFLAQTSPNSTHGFGDEYRELASLEKVDLEAELTLVVSEMLIQDLLPAT